MSGWAHHHITYNIRTATMAATAAAATPTARLAPPLEGAIEYPDSEHLEMGARMAARALLTAAPRASWDWRSSS